MGHQTFIFVIFSMFIFCFCPISSLQESEEIFFLLVCVFLAIALGLGAELSLRLKYSQNEMLVGNIAGAYLEKLAWNIDFHGSRGCGFGNMAP